MRIKDGSSADKKLQLTWNFYLDNLLIFPRIIGSVNERVLIDGLKDHLICQAFQLNFGCRCNLTHDISPKIQKTERKINHEMLFEFFVSVSINQIVGLFHNILYIRFNLQNRISLYKFIIHDGMINSIKCYFR